MNEEKILNSWDLYLESMKQITYMSAQHKVYLIIKHNNPVGSGPTYTYSHNGGRDWGALS